MIEVNIKKEDVNMAIKDSDIETWHKRLDHIGEQGLETLTKKGFLPSFTGFVPQDLYLLFGQKGTHSSF